MKKLVTSTNIIFFLWGIVLLTISQLYSSYTRYYLYLSIIIIVPVMIVNLINQKREDKVNGTKEFLASIYRMVFMALVLGVFFFVTRQKYL